MFTPQKQIKLALGTFTQPDDKMFFLEMEKMFTPMPKPEPGDWLFNQKQKHQSFDLYREPYVNYITPEKKTIYLLPFGRFDKLFMEKLVMFCQAFYPNTLVKILPQKDLIESIPNIRKRNNVYGQQFVCDDILAFMKTCVPKDAYCVMGITLKDLYPGPNWNYVYGWATYKARVGIFSFVRWDHQYACGQKKQIDWQMILYPSIRTMVHEIGHMFAVTHCVYYRCLMNGYNNIQENYRNPLQFCPICCRKLFSNLKYNRESRYAKLIEVSQKLKLEMLDNDTPLYKQLLELSVKAAKLNTNNNKQRQSVNKVIKPAINSRGVSMPGRNIRR